MATATACERVFEIAELLEQILLNVAILPAHYPDHDFSDPFSGFHPNGSALNSYREDYCTLLACQRVSTVFRDTIAGSTLLQQALFFTPPQTASQQPLACTLVHFASTIRCPPCTVYIYFVARETVRIDVSGCTWQQAAPVLVKMHFTSSARRIHLGSAGCKVTSILVTAPAKEDDGGDVLTMAMCFGQQFTYDVDMVDATIGEVIGQAASMQINAPSFQDA